VGDSFGEDLTVSIVNIWQGKISVNTANVVLQSVNNQIEFYFLPLHVSVVMRPSSGSIMIVRLKLLNF
jgi:hypothetical protein